MEWYLKVLKNYVGFEGRAQRKEYWMFALISFIISFVLTVIEFYTQIYPILTSLYSLFILLPSLAVCVRRLHDTGRSGWYILLGLIPFVGAIILLVFAVQDSQPSENQYGPNPKAGYNY